MKNFIDSNLININPENVPSGTLAIKIGNNVFTAGNINIDEYGEPYVVVDDNGTLKAQKLSFDGTTPNDSGEPEVLTANNVKVFNTGHTEPSGTVSGRGMNFYKCATVDTVNETWTGYKAVLTNGVYSYESTATTGLTYSIVTPTVGLVYTDGALIRASLYEGMPPANGLVFYAPLSSVSATAETGQTLNITGTVTYQTHNGVQCGYFNGASVINGNDSVISGANPFSISVWCKARSAGGFVYCFGTLNGVNSAPFFGIASGVYGFSFCYNDDRDPGITYDSNWHNFIVVFDGTDAVTYKDGVQVRSYNFGTANVGAGFTVGDTSWSGGKWNGYIAALRVYNRTLTQNEIATLASEFTPTNS